MPIQVETKIMLQKSAEQNIIHEKYKNITIDLHTIQFHEFTQTFDYFTEFHYFSRPGTF